MGDLWSELAGVLAELEAAGAAEAAAAIRRRCLEPAFTTSTEWLGEIGTALAGLSRRDRRRLPPATRARLLAVLAEVARVWPNFYWLVWRWRLFG